MNNRSTICFVAGKSGGHLIPALTLAQHRLKKYPHDIINFFSTTSLLDKKILDSSDSLHQTIALSLGNIPYKQPWKYPVFLYKFASSWIKSFYHLYRIKPQKVISTGGFVSLPVCSAAWLLGIPVEIYELNAVPGKATRFLTPCAHTIHVCFSQAQRFFPAHKTTYSPYPVRFTKPSHTVSRKEAHAKIHLEPTKKTILVLGGSQGSLFINAAIKNLLEQNPSLHETIQLIHQTGSNTLINWKALYNKLGIPAHVFEYHDDMKLFYTAADLILCRAGAGTLFEILFFKKSCITIPLKAATTNHQVDNARAMAQEHPHLFTVIQQDNVEQQLFETIKQKLQL